MSGQHRAFTPIRVTLAVVIVTLCSFLGLILWRGTEASKLLAVKPIAIAIAQPDLAIGFSNTPIDFTVVRTRPLFYSSREFYIAPDPALAVPTLPKPDYRLTGTINSPVKGMIALLSPTNGGATRKVIAGDDLDGWVIKTVEANKVGMEAGGELYEIVSGKRAVSGGMTMQPLIRASASAESSGTRMLGSGGSLSANVASKQPLISTPRLYSPPP